MKKESRDLVASTGHLCQSPSRALGRYIKGGTKDYQAEEGNYKKNLCSSRAFCLVDDLLHPHDFNHMIILSKSYPLVPIKSFFVF